MTDPHNYEELDCPFIIGTKSDMSNLMMSLGNFLRLQCLLNRQFQWLQCEKTKALEDSDDSGLTVKLPIRQSKPTAAMLTESRRKLEWVMESEDECHWQRWCSCSSLFLLYYDWSHPYNMAGYMICGDQYKMKMQSLLSKGRKKMLLPYWGTIQNCFLSYSLSLD